MYREIRIVYVPILAQVCGSPFWVVWVFTQTDSHSGNHKLVKSGFGMGKFHRILVSFTISCSPSQDLTILFNTPWCSGHPFQEPHGNPFWESFPGMLYGNPFREPFWRGFWQSCLSTRRSFRKPFQESFRQFVWHPFQTFCRYFTSRLKYALSKKSKSLHFMIFRAIGNVKDLLKPLFLILLRATRLSKLSQEKYKPTFGNLSV